VLAVLKLALWNVLWVEVAPSPGVAKICIKASPRFHVPDHGEDFCSLSTYRGMDTSSSSSTVAIEGCSWPADGAAVRSQLPACICSGGRLPC
jgi:hypothetical protein